MDLNLQEKERSSSSIFVSIVILAYSERRLVDLKELLNSIEQQTYHLMELVFVIERSKPIVHYVRDRSSKYPTKIYFSPQKISVATARNIGVNQSSGDIIAFLDDDAELTDGWAEHLVSCFLSYPQAIGVTGKIVPRWKHLSDRDCFPKSLYWMIGCSTWKDSEEIHYTNATQTLNTAYRKDIFRTNRFAIEQFKDENRGSLYRGRQGDDIEFAMRATSTSRRKIVYDPSLVVFHKVYSERTAIGFVKRYAFWQGFTEASYAKDRPSRKGTYSTSARNLLFDMFSIGGNSWQNLRKKFILVIAVSYFVLGYFSFKSKKMLSLADQCLLNE